MTLTSLFDASWVSTAADTAARDCERGAAGHSAIAAATREDRSRSFFIGVSGKRVLGPEASGAPHDRGELR